MGEWRPPDNGYNWIALFWWALIIAVVLTPTVAAVIDWLIHLG